MSKPTRLAVVTYREWLNWIADGALRLHERAIKFTADISAEEFCSMMEKAPDVSRYEDQAYLIAVLRKGKKTQDVIPKADSHRARLVPISDVISFHPMCSRGGALLKGDARRSYAKLGSPLCETHWFEWVKANKEHSRSVASKYLTEAFGLPLFSPKEDIANHIFYEFADDPLNALKNISLKCNTDFEETLKKARKLHRQPAYGWWLALVTYKELLQDKARLQFEEACNESFKKFVMELRSTEKLNEPVSSWTAAIELSKDVTSQYAIQIQPEITLSQLAMIYHYQHVIAELGTIDISVLSDDLRYLVENQSPDAASLAAHYIGRNLDCAAAAGLYYRSGGSVSNDVIDIDRLPSIESLIQKNDLDQSEDWCSQEKLVL